MGCSRKKSKGRLSWLVKEGRVSCDLFLSFEKGRPVFERKK